MRWNVTANSGTLENNTLPYHTVEQRVGKFQKGRVLTSKDEQPVSVQTDLARAVIDQLMDYIKIHGLH
ncbi:hypothetical protein TNCV_937821 [Trichonephila clavipes]|nr:hypothetical protein TNCV_937821 [Trichonephila clavipes]